MIIYQELIVVRLEGLVVFIVHLLKLGDGVARGVLPGRFGLSLGEGDQGHVVGQVLILWCSAVGLEKALVLTSEGLVEYLLLLLRAVQIPVRVVDAILVRVSRPRDQGRR